MGGGKIKGIKWLFYFSFLRSKLIHEESFLATHFTAEHGKFGS